jgi:hypothetical protein
MTSEKQIAANRANAVKSTGPKTAESKTASSMNALRHGLTGQVNLMPDEDREAHDKFCAAIVESLAAEGALEIQFAQAIAEDNWRMNRGRAIETNMFALGHISADSPMESPGNPEIDAALNVAQIFAAAPNKFQLLSLYMQRTNRDMQKSLDRLAILQAERKARRQQDLEEVAALMEYNEIKHLPIENTETKGANGFVFSIHQIHAFVTRRTRLKQAQTAQHKADDRMHNRKHGNGNNGPQILSQAA